MGWLDVVGWGGSALLVFSLLQSSVLRFRVLNLIACVILIFFNLVLAIWPMVGMNLVLSAINLYFIVKLLRQRHDASSFTVLQVQPDDAYLQHVVGVHSKDIATYNPGFAIGETRSEKVHTYLVQRGDETVGVVVVEVQGDEAHVVLDYVTPRFRDFSPGEFVWRRSRLLEELGVQRVVTRPGMVDAYYAKLGFAAVGDHYELAR
ncbi:MAG: hypothetical protein V9F00_02810 [Nocardioides sp.]